MNKSIQNIYYLSMLLLFLNSMHAWFTWNIKTHFLGIFITCISIVLFILNKNIVVFSTKRVIVALLFIIAVGIGKNENLNGYLGSIFTIMPCVLFFFIKQPKYYEDMLR